MKYIFIWLIRLYQHTISPDHGICRGRFPYGFCRHYPTCSEYARLSILRFGVFKGVLLGLSRVVRCNPFVESKIDKVPNI